MNNPDFYKGLYQLLEKPSPLGFDCGRLCGAACCELSPDLPGMFLFPGEEELFLGMTGFTITETRLPGFGSVKLLSCQGSCDRSTRPLSCRVFPLAPRVADGHATTRMDPRGRPVCPLCHQSKAALSGRFISAVEAVFNELLAEPSAAAFISALSRHLDEYEKPLF